MQAPRNQEQSKPLRVRSVGTKVTEAEHAQCEKAAAQRGQTLSEWCRQVVLETATAPARAVETEVILSELLALRKIVINLLYRHAGHEPLTERSMRELIEAADRDKIPKAIERLRAVRTTQAEVPSDA